jgi:L-fuconate dehydratase
MEEDTRPGARSAVDPRATIVRLDVVDVRYPTSLELDGSDAVNIDPDYSAAYVTLTLDDPAATQGFGLSFTTGRGTEVVVAAVEALRPVVLGRTLGQLQTGIGALCRDLTGETQLRWIGPEKGALHLGTAAVLNAAWDLLARIAGKPLWRYLADLEPDAIVEAIAFHYIEDALTPADVVAILERNRPTRAEREAILRRDGFPAYTTSAGWLGYDDKKIDRLCRAALADGWTRFKMKVGADLDDDLRRGRMIRGLIGDEALLAIDANQRWGIDEAIDWVNRMAEIRPYWIEEPTSPDDILGHARIASAVAPVLVATGEHVHNRVMFKQLFQANAIGVCQIDAARVAGVNENLAILFMAAMAGVPVVPHAGGVGLCELVQHLAVYDYLCVGASLDGRMIEYVDHLHEHFTDPVVVSGGRYRLPERPGYSAEMRPGSVRRYAFPDGEAWSRAGETT